jgi:hypothetical protein
LFTQDWLRFFRFLRLWKKESKNFLENIKAYRAYDEARAGFKYEIEHLSENYLIHIHKGPHSQRIETTRPWQTEGFVTGKSEI